MGRPSALSHKQWADVERRLLKGEGVRALAREYGISGSAISQRFSERKKNIEAVANQMFEAEMAFKNLSTADQVSAQTLIDELRAVSMHLAGAAKYGAMTAHRLSGIANQQVGKLNEVNPGDDASVETLRTIAAYVEVANKSARTGMDLLAANKESIQGGNVDVSSLSDEELRKLAKG